MIPPTKHALVAAAWILWNLSETTGPTQGGLTLPTSRDWRNLDSFETKAECAPALSKKLAFNAPIIREMKASGWNVKATTTGKVIVKDGVRMEEVYICHPAGLDPRTLPPPIR